MKSYITVIAVAILFSSCLKQSIADAMLPPVHKANSVTATLSYEQNGKPISIKVTDADEQSRDYYTLGVEKHTGSYVLSGLGDSSEIIDVLDTDTLTAGEYDYIGDYGDMYFLSFNNYAAYAHDPSDYFNLTITSSSYGHISGTFSAQLTPLVDGGSNIFGAPGTVKVTKGVFQNVPVFYP